MHPPLLVTRDPVLVDEVTRLAAAAGGRPEVAPPEVAVLRAWVRAPVALVGHDAAAQLAGLGPPRRGDVHLVGLLGVTPSDLRIALALGAEQVLALPDDATWLTERLIDAGDDGLAPGPVIAVVGGSGGAGATTLACALGQVAARSGPAVVVDADPLGPGLDRVLGVDEVAGVRWADLGSASGRLGARSLREALPRRDGLGVLTWAPGPRAGPSEQTLRECLSAARRGHDVVVVDLPRQVGPRVADVVARCDLLVVVTRATVCGATSAAGLVEALAPFALGGLVVRGHGLDPGALTGLIGLPLLTEMTDQRRVAESVDLGLGPVRGRRGPLARAAAEVLVAAA